MNEKIPPTEQLQKILTRIKSLAHRETRDRQQSLWIEGIRPFVQAFDAHWQFESILYSRILCPSDLAEMLTRRLAARGIPRLRVSPEQFRSISTTPRASGIGAILRQRWTPLNQARAHPGLCWLIIEQIRSPGNLGTILRTAEACNASGIIFLTPASDPFDPAVVRAAMGGIFHLPLIRTTPEKLQHWAKSEKIQLVALSPEAPALWTALPRNTPLALVLGEERRGLSPRLRHLCPTSIRLPMPGRADSLNVAVATAVVMYELIRRQTEPVA